MTRASRTGEPRGLTADETNLYRYAGNSPLHGTDPSGAIAVWDSVYGPGGFVDRNAEAFFQEHADAARWMAARSDAEVVGASVALAVPVGIGIYFGAPIAAGLGVGYFALQGGISAAETGLEGAVAYATGSQFNALASFSKNVAVNSLTGGIATKLKWGGKVGAYLLRQGIEVAGDTAIDVGVYGNDLGQSLAWNIVGGVGGEALATGIGRGLRSLHNNFDVRLNPGALAIFNSGPPVNLISISRRVSNRTGLTSFPEWNVGDSITKVTPEGNYPTWATIRSRYWQNRVATDSASFGPANRAIMEKGFAPKARAMVRYRKSAEIKEILVQKDLHHARGNRGVPGFDDPMDLREVWPWEHENLLPPGRYLDYDFIGFK